MSDTEDFEPILAEAIRRTGVHRYRFLCLEHPDRETREGYRRIVREIASKPDTRKASYPSVPTQAKNLFRSMVGFVRSGLKLAPRAVRRERLAICGACLFYDPIQKRCRKCGCANSAKVFVAADSCPLDPPKWSAVP